MPLLKHYKIHYIICCSIFLCALYFIVKVCDPGLEKVWSKVVDLSRVCNLATYALGCRIDHVVSVQDEAMVKRSLSATYLCLLVCKGQS